MEDIIPDGTPESLIEELKQCPELKDIFIDAHRLSEQRGQFEKQFNKFYNKVLREKSKAFKDCLLPLVKKVVKDWDVIETKANPKRKRNSEQPPRKDEKKSKTSTNNDLELRPIKQECNPITSNSTTPVSEEDSHSRDRSSVMKEKPPEVIDLVSDDEQQEMNEESDKNDEKTRSSSVEKENHEGNNMAALPYADRYIPVPDKCQSSKWPLTQEKSDQQMKRFEEKVMKFCDEKSGTAPKKLFIYDTLLKPMKIRSTIKDCETINLCYPTPFSPFFEVLDKLRNEGRNNYNISTIYICYGIDLITRAEGGWLDEPKEFMKKLSDFIDRDFCQKPQGTNGSDSFQCPNIVFITIPSCGKDFAKTFSGRIQKLNNYFRDYVLLNNEKYGEKLKIVDWCAGIDEVAETEALKNIKAMNKEMRDMRLSILRNMLDKN